MQLQEPID